MYQKGQVILVNAITDMYEGQSISNDNFSYMFYVFSHRLLGVTSVCHLS